MIGGDEWRRLRNKSDADGQDKLKYAKWLDDPIYKNLEAGVLKGTAKDNSKISGQESVAGALAANDFRMAAIDFLKKNPNASAVDLATYMRPMVKEVSENYNTVMKEESDRAKADADTQKIITDLKLKDAEAAPVLANEGKIPHQTRPVTNQVLRATAGEKAMKAKDQAAEQSIKFGPKNEASYQSWLKLHPDMSGSDAELRLKFKNKG